jgi:hypothetical protein
MPGDGCLCETAIRHVGGKTLDMTSVKQGRHAAETKYDAVARLAAQGKGIFVS